ncbi:hypothetical protein HW126_21260 [Salinispora sp. H7-4]|nr:hypothetical protein [Salinispora sp. H7-4]
MSRRLPSTCLTTLPWRLVRTPPAWTRPAAILRARRAIVQVAVAAVVPLRSAFGVAPSPVRETDCEQEGGAGQHGQAAGEEH